jgi:hypothetical protein
MSFGQIDAGSSVALTMAANQMAGLLSEMQKDKAQAAVMSAQAQGEMSKASATATVQAADKEAQQLQMQAIAAGVQGGMGLVTAGCEAVSTYKLGAAMKPMDDLRAFNKNISSMSDKATEVNFATKPASITKQDIDSHFEACKRSLLSEDEGSPQFLESHAKYMTKAQLTELSEKANAKISRFNDRYNQIAGKIEKGDKALENLSGFASNAASAGTNVAQMQMKKDQAANQAMAQVANMASSQMNQTSSNFQSAADKDGDKIAQFFASKEQAINNMVWRG